MTRLIKTFPHPWPLSRRARGAKPFSPWEKGGESKARGLKAGDFFINYLELPGYQFPGSPCASGKNASFQLAGCVLMTPVRNICSAYFSVPFGACVKR